MKNIRKFLRFEYKRVRSPLISWIPILLIVLSHPNVGGAAVIGCPAAPITLAAAQKVDIDFVEEPGVQEVCVFRVTDLALIHHGNIIFMESSKVESDRLVFTNTNINGVDQATFCFASDPDLAQCTKDKGDVDDIVKFEDAQLPTSFDTLFQGKNDKALSVKMTSDGEIFKEGTLFCSDTLTFGTPPKGQVSSQEPSGCPCTQCSIPEPRTFDMFGLGVGAMVTLLGFHKRPNNRSCNTREADDYANIFS